MLLRTQKNQSTCCSRWTCDMRSDQSVHESKLPSSTRPWTLHWRYVDVSEAPSNRVLHTMLTGKVRIYSRVKRTVYLHTLRLCLGGWASSDKSPPTVKYVRNAKDCNLTLTNCGPDIRHHQNARGGCHRILFPCFWVHPSSFRFSTCSIDSLSSLSGEWHILALERTWKVWCTYYSHYERHLSFFVSWAIGPIFHLRSDLWHCNGDIGV